MNILRRSEDRGHVNHGWLDSHHSFSFASYQDPEHEHFGALRVINEDRVIPGKGFGTHGHRNMEIVSYVLEGALQHRDSLGNGSIIRPGDVQRLSAGTGIQHSEFNGSSIDPVHFLQIWIEPNKNGIPAAYEEKHFDSNSKRGRLRLIVSSDGRDGSVLIHQDAFIYVAMLDGAERAVHPLAAERRAYVHVARGSLSVNGQLLNTGDAIKISDEPEVVLEKGNSSEALLLDLP
jgi:quercetin 2,3-dioxygenase